MYIYMYMCVCIYLYICCCRHVHLLEISTACVLAFNRVYTSFDVSVFDSATANHAS